MGNGHALQHQGAAAIQDATAVAGRVSPLDGEVPKCVGLTAGVNVEHAERGRTGVDDT